MERESTTTTGRSNRLVGAEIVGPGSFTDYRLKGDLPANSPRNSRATVRGPRGPTLEDAMRIEKDGLVLTKGEFPPASTVLLRMYRPTRQPRSVAPGFFGTRQFVETSTYLV